MWLLQHLCCCLQAKAAQQCTATQLPLLSTLWRAAPATWVASWCSTMTGACHASSDLKQQAQQQGKSSRAAAGAAAGTAAGAAAHIVTAACGSCSGMCWFCRHLEARDHVLTRQFCAACRTYVQFKYLDQVLQHGELPAAAHQEVPDILTTFGHDKQAAQHFALGMTGASLGEAHMPSACQTCALQLVCTCCLAHADTEHCWHDADARHYQSVWLVEHCDWMLVCINWPYMS